MEFLGEVDGALTHRKYAETLGHLNYIQAEAAIRINYNIRIQGERTDILGTFSACYVTQRVTWLQNAR